MAENNSNNEGTTGAAAGSGSGSSGARRSSFTGETFANIFGRRSSVHRPSGADASPPPNEGPITSAARRLSMTTFGALSTSPGNTAGAGRRESSVGTNNGGGAGSGGLNESAIDEDEAAEGEAPATSFTRRMSSNARALWEGRTGAGNANGNGPAANVGSPKEGFNWSDNFRTRAERASSIASANGMGSLGHNRSRSIASSDSPPAKRAGIAPAPAAAPPQPPKPKERPRPDHFQERILKGDFYMD